MPVNYQEIQRQIREMGRQAPQREEMMRQLRQQAQQLLDEYAGRLDDLRRRVEQAILANAALRCAVPTHEPLDTHLPPPERPDALVLLAADGSQVNPNRHDPVEFGVINVGAIRMCPGQGQAPQEIVRTQLLVFDDLNTPTGSVTDELVALKRDLGEREMLAALVAQESLPVVTLTDGPLELFREPKDQPEFRDAFQDYLFVLRQLAGMRAVTAGYVDKPRADLVVRLLELLTFSDDQLADAGRQRPFRGIADVELYQALLAPGERSALFSIQSSSAEKFPGELALHFFYLNVGVGDHPSLARVEIPAWVARDANLLELLHATLVIQCRQLGSRPYPYILHRAHEVAVVTFEEKRQLSEMIQTELRRNGVPVGQGSNKQFAKDQAFSRTRYKI